MGRKHTAPSAAIASVDLASQKLHQANALAQVLAEYVCVDESKREVIVDTDALRWYFILLKELISDGRAAAMEIDPRFGLREAANG